MHREYPRSRFWIGWCMQTLQKNEATWYGVLRHYDAGFDTALRVFEGQWNRRDSIQCYATFNRWNDKRKVNINRNDNDWNDNWWFAGVRNSLHFSSALAGEFCLLKICWEDLASCPFHPPSILPISSNFKDKAIYFLVSNDFASHKTSRRTLRVSIFLMARRTYGALSTGDKNEALATVSIVSTNKLSIFKPKENRLALAKLWWYSCHKR